MALRSPLDALVTEHALSFLSTSQNAKFIDAVLDGDIAVTSGELPVKNVCAKVSVELSNEIDSICGLLDCSKRQFIECALLEAINKANNILREEGVFDRLEAQNKGEL